MSDSKQNKTKPTGVEVDRFLESVSSRRQQEAEVLMTIMKEISGLEATMWGPSIIGFGMQHYRYASGREGDMPRLAFSPRKAALTVYFNEGFGGYGDLLKRLGKHKTSVSCLYVTKLEDVDLDVLRTMLKHSWEGSATGTPSNR